MAPYVPVQDCMLVEVRYLIEGQQTENVFTFSTGGESFVSAAQAVYDVLETGWWPIIRNFFSTALAHDSVHITDMSAQDGPIADFGAFANPAGTVNTGSAPLNVAACVSLKTNKRGRSFRGRKYMGPPALGLVAGSFLTTTGAGVLNDGFESLLSSAGASAVPLVVVSRKSNGVFRTEGVQTLVTSARLNDNVLDSQRRRLPGRGQ